MTLIISAFNWLFWTVYAALEAGCEKRGKDHQSKLDTDSTLRAHDAAPLQTLLLVASRMVLKSKTQIWLYNSLTFKPFDGSL